MHYFLTDGTEDGFYTAVFCAYEKKAKDAVLGSDKNVQTGLFDLQTEVETDEEKVARVKRKFSSIDKKCLQEISMILRSGNADKEQTAFLYLREILRENAPVREMLAKSEARNALALVQNVAYETHRVSGFLRFHETESGTYYSPYSPDNDITELLMPHFFARLKKIPFIIHDVKRKKAGISDGTRWTIVFANDAAVLFSKDEENFLHLWTDYYQNVAIPERKNTRQMKQSMPVRYWKFMPEKQAEEKEKLAPKNSDEP